LLIDDVNSFGELLYNLATGQEPPAQGEPNPGTGNTVFDALVMNCISSEVAAGGYTSLADNALWRDLRKAQTFESQRKRTRALPRITLTQPSLGVVAVILFCLLLLTITARVMGQ
jgi:hypothetical protein